MTAGNTILPLAARVSISAGKLVSADGIIEFEGGRQPFTVSFGDVIDNAPTEPPKPAIPFTSRVDEMPTNSNPDHPYILERGWFGWPTSDDIRGITIHHTMSHSPLAIAQYCTRPQSKGGKGYPTTQYHYWVSADDGCPVWQLVEDDVRLWHDHTGAMQHNLSVGMAGRLHEAPPPQEQIEAAARLVLWLVDKYDFGPGAIAGHCSRYAGTVCPGWDEAGWKTAFFEALGV